MFVALKHIFSNKATIFAIKYFLENRQDFVLNSKTSRFMKSETTTYDDWTYEFDFSKLLKKFNWTCNLYSNRKQKFIIIPVTTQNNRKQTTTVLEECNIENARLLSRNENSKISAELLLSYFNIQNMSKKKILFKLFEKYLLSSNPSASDEKVLKIQNEIVDELLESYAGHLVEEGFIELFNLFSAEYAQYLLLPINELYRCNNFCKIKINNSRIEFKNSRFSFFRNLSFTEKLKYFIHSSKKNFYAIFGITRYDYKGRIFQNMYSELITIQKDCKIYNPMIFLKKIDKQNIDYYSINNITVKSNHNVLYWYLPKEWIKLGTITKVVKNNNETSNNETNLEKIVGKSKYLKNIENGIYTRFYVRSIFTSYIMPAVSSVFSVILFSIYIKFEPVIFTEEGYRQCIISLIVAATVIFAFVPYKGESKLSTRLLLYPRVFCFFSMFLSLIIGVNISLGNCILQDTPFCYFLNLAIELSITIYPLYYINLFLLYLITYFRTFKSRLIKTNSIFRYLFPMCVNIFYIHIVYQLNEILGLKIIGGILNTTIHFLSIFLGCIFSVFQTY